MDLVQVSVKNSFLHFSEPSGTVPEIRRCSSVPASARLLRCEAEAKACPASLSDVAGVAGLGRWSELSTAADSASELNDEEVDAQSLVSSAESGPRQPARRATAGPERASRRTPLCAHARPYQPEAAAAPSSASAASLPAAPPPPPAAAPRRTRPGDVLAVVVAAAAAALAGCGNIKLTGPVAGPRGWSIIARMRAEDLGDRERALAAAKAALLRAAKASGNVHVLGHRAQPFLSTPVGFAASLGLVEDESVACWSMVGQGFCRKGAACHWKHPSSQTTVNVMVQVDRA